MTLRWTTSNAREVSIDRGIGEVARNGSLRVTINATRTYTLTAENRNGVDVECTTTIVVDDEEEENDLVCTLTATPSRIDEGDTVTLRWTTENATRVSINNGVGTVARNGSLRVTLNNDRTYTLTAENRDGDEIECTRTITVDDENDNDNDNDNVRCDAFTARPDTISERERVTLRWSTTGADSVTINNGIGNVSDDGSREITVARDVTFTLTARNGNDVDTCRVEIEFDEDEDDDDNDRNTTNPRCVLTISDTSIRAGESVRLSWNNERTDDIILRDNHGKTLINTNRSGSNEDPDRDQITVRPTQTTTYTLTAENGSRERECRVRVEVDNLNLTSVRGQDTILLSQVPYTGFEAGPTLTMIFYVAIALWGIAVAYALVVKKKPTHKVTVQAPIVTHKTEEVVTTTTTTSDFVPANLPIADSTELGTMPLHDEAFQALEAHAHANYALFSSDALRFIASQNDVLEDQMATLDRVIALAKAKYPKEGDWVVVNKERVINLLG